MHNRSQLYLSPGQCIHMRKVRDPRVFHARVGSSLPHFDEFVRSLRTLYVSGLFPSRRAGRFPKQLSLSHHTAHCTYSIPTTNIYQSIKTDQQNQHHINPINLNNKPNHNHNRHHVPRRHHRFSRRPHQRALLLNRTSIHPLSSN